MEASQDDVDGFVLAGILLSMLVIIPIGIVIITLLSLLGIVPMLIWTTIKYLKRLYDSMKGLIK